MAREVQFGIRLTGDSKGAVNAMRLTDKELGKLRRELDRTDRRVRQHRQGLQGWAQGLMSIRRVLAPLAGMAGVSLLARTTRNVIEQTAAISESADMAGITAERYQELTKAFSDMAGVAENTTATALQQFNTRLGQAAAGTGTAGRALNTLGVSARTAAGNIRNTQAVLEDAMRRLSEVESEAERAALASDLFGRSAGPQLAAALGQGDEALQKQIQSLREHGRILDNETVRNARAANDELNKMRDIISTRMARGILDHADAYMRMAEALALVAEKGMDALAGITNISRFLAESAAARIGGIAGDDIVRLENEAERIRSILEGGAFRQAERLRFFGPGGVVKWWSEDELRAELARIDQSIGAYYSTPRTTLEPIDVRVRPRFEEEPSPAPAGTTAIDRFPDQFQQLADRLDPVSAATRQYMADVAMLDQAWARGMVSGERYWDLLTRLATGEGEGGPDLTAAARRVYEQTRTEMELLYYELEHLDTLLEANAINWDTYSRAVFNAWEQIDKAAESTERMNDLGASLGMTFSSAFEEAIVSGGRFRDVLQGIFDDILRIMTRTMISQPLADAAGGFFSSLFGGARASGGPVSGGRTYVVGEHGPELFTPRTSGAIIPNHALGGGLQVNIVNNVGANVTTRERQTPQGMSIDVMIDQAVAQKLGERGSDSNRMLRAGFGMRPTLAGR